MGPRDRPEIKTLTTGPIKPSGTMEITTNGAVDSQASIIRYSSNKYTVDADQRHIAVQLKKTEVFMISAEPGIALLGHYMLFVLKDGTPSHSVNVKVAAVWLAYFAMATA
ncbi:hypothetical protein N7530_012775 [Penicillium desertorum]|uniref:Galactose oxidase-like Early set domain-containing protein n=1 Tax=Penicillium desertorum TaxID=1303715 RepID=A0A9W9WDC8_9EURO|nr:hypothetical protein N7530_012775 [Penicillium desertorum]